VRETEAATEEVVEAKMDELVVEDEAAEDATEAAPEETVTSWNGDDAADEAAEDVPAGTAGTSETPEPEKNPEWRPVVLKWRTPIAVATLALLVGVVVRLGVHWSTLPVLAFASTAVALAVVDFAILRLPNDLTLPTALAVVVTLVVQALAEGRPHLLVTELEGGAGVAGFYLLLFAISRGGLGFGDVKVGAIAGLLMASRDWRHVFDGTFLAYLITLAIALVLLTQRRKKFPYGPGLLAGTIAVLLLS
jgi:leader peptidase (prepilin peptidase)/N-methyltransferase